MSPIDLNLIHLHEELFIKHRWLNIFITLSIYFTVILLFGEQLKISNNYFVILPVISLAISFGPWGGLIAGILALPLNLLMFHLLGHPEYSPESKIIAEISGIIIGGSFGYLSDFFYRLMQEINLRRKSEEKLKQSLHDKEVMLREIHHRVKNNINLIKSLIQLQSNRIEDSKMKEECNKLNRRVFSIALVQDLLYSEHFSDQINLNEYLTLLLQSLTMSGNSQLAATSLNLPNRTIVLETKKVTPLGLIVNEVITNTFKYADLEHNQLKIKLKLTLNDLNATLIIEDNGPGFPEIPVPERGLGFKLIKSLAVQLQGKIEFRNDKGALTQITFPVKVVD